MTMPSIDIDAFTWSNLQSDVFQYRHANAMLLYLKKVVNPALDAVDAEHEKMSRSDEPAAVFQVNDMAVLRESTTQAFTLSVQSLWERQLREYLKECARELKYDASFVGKLEMAKWADLLKYFQKLRGVPLQDFDSYPYLDLLQMIGNACRHGDGVSARKLYERRSDLWPNWPPRILPDWLGASLHNVNTVPLFSQIRLPRSLLEQLTQAVIWFWEDHRYIYTNSIACKHPSIVGALAKMREERARRKWPGKCVGQFK